MGDDSRPAGLDMALDELISSTKSRGRGGRGGGGGGGGGRGARPRSGNSFFGYGSLRSDAIPQPVVMQSDAGFAGPVRRGRQREGSVLDRVQHGGSVLDRVQLPPGAETAGLAASRRARFADESEARSKNEKIRKEADGTVVVQLYDTDVVAARPGPAAVFCSRTEPPVCSIRI